MTKETKKNVDTINHGSIKRTPKRAAKKLTALLLSVIMVVSGVVGVWGFDDRGEEFWLAQQPINGTTHEEVYFRWVDDPIQETLPVERDWRRLSEAGIGDGELASEARKKYLSLLEGDYPASEIRQRFLELFGERATEDIRDNFSEIFDIPEGLVDRGLLNILLASPTYLSWSALEHYGFDTDSLAQYGFGPESNDKDIFEFMVSNEHVFETMYQKSGLVEYLATEDRIAPDIELSVLSSEIHVRHNTNNLIFAFEQADINLFRGNNYNTWRNRMQTTFDDLHRLSGWQSSFSGVRTEIQTTRYRIPNLWGQSGNPILINRTFVPQLINQINQRGDWSFGVMHELSHNFDSWRWTFDHEFFANFKMAYVVDRNNATIFAGYTGFYTGLAQLRQYYRADANASGGGLSHTEAMRRGVYHHDALTYTFLRIQQSIGWEPFRQTFRHFHDMSGSHVPLSNIEKLNYFISRLSDYSGQDVFGMFNANERAIYERHFNGQLRYASNLMSVVTFRYTSSGHTDGLPPVDHSINTPGHIAIQSPNMTRVGYNFVGWRNGGHIYNAGDSFYFEAGRSGVFIFDAVWEIAQNVTLTFNSNNRGITSNPAPLTRTPGTTMGAMPSQPVWTGHHFLGWFDTSGPTGGNQLTSTARVPDRNTTYYARWEATVTFDALGGSILPPGAPNQIRAVVGSRITLPGLTPPTNLGRGFDDAELDGMIDIEPSSMIILNGWFGLNGVFIGNPNDPVEIHENLQLRAIWNLPVDANLDDGIYRIKRPDGFYIRAISDNMLMQNSNIDDSRGADLWYITSTGDGRHYTIESIGIRGPNMGALPHVLSGRSIATPQLGLAPYDGGVLQQWRIMRQGDDIFFINRAHPTARINVTGTFVEVSSTQVGAEWRLEEYDRGFAWDGRYIQFPNEGTRPTVKIDIFRSAIVSEQGLTFAVYNAGYDWNNIANIRVEQSIFLEDTWSPSNAVFSVRVEGHDFQNPTQLGFYTLGDFSQLNQSGNLMSIDDHWHHGMIRMSVMDNFTTPAFYHSILDRQKVFIHEVGHALRLYHPHDMHEYDSSFLPGWRPVSVMNQGLFSTSQDIPALPLGYDRFNLIRKWGQ